MIDLEDVCQKLESVANTLRGMTFDARIPAEVRSILQDRATQIDAVCRKINPEAYTY